MSAEEAVQRARQASMSASKYAYYDYLPMDALHRLLHEMESFTVEASLSPAPPSAPARPR